MTLAEKLGVSNVVEALAPAVDLHQDFAYYERSLWAQQWLPVPVLINSYYRLAQLHGMDLKPGVMPIDAARLAALGNAAESNLFSAGERACLAYTEAYFSDPASITDDMSGQVKYHYLDEGLVVLMQALGLFDGSLRLQRVFGLGGAK